MKRLKRNLSIYTRVLFIPKNHSGESRSAPLDLVLNPDRPDLAQSATTILKRIDDHLSHDLLYSIKIGVILKLHDDSGFTVIFGDSDRNSRGDQTAGCGSRSEERRVGKEGRAGWWRES